MPGKVFHIQEEVLRNAAAAVLDLLMPRSCIVCGRQLRTHEKHLCPWCLSDLPLTYFWLQGRNQMADKFNLMIQRDIDRRVLKGEETSPPDYIWAAALFFYRSGTGYRKITQSLKYHSDIRAGRFFAGMLALRLRDCQYLAQADAVVPVPLHWSRRWSRGYNQAEVIAAALVESGCGGTMIPDLLVRNRKTKTQTKLAVGQKAGNVRGAFSVNAKYARRPGSILLVDDVFTTGATLYECWKVLREWAPEARISIATLGFVG